MLTFVVAGQNGTCADDRCRKQLTKNIFSHTITVKGTDFRDCRSPRNIFFVKKIKAIFYFNKDNKRIILKSRKSIRNDNNKIKLQISHENQRKYVFVFYNL